MIPYLAAKTFSLGPLTVQVWGTFVALGFLIGLLVSARRAKRKVLDPQIVWDMGFWIFIAAMLGARLFHVFLYEPAYYLGHPWEALDPRAPGFAIYGGVVGGVSAVCWYAYRRSLDMLAYIDTLAWGMPWGCGIGRIGCFLIHDHPGTWSSSFLAVKYPDGQTRHDLGLYLSLAGFAIGVVFLLLDRRNRHPGFFFGAFLLLDGMVRAWLDLYRVADVRYAGLTPTQWFVLPAMALGAWFMWRRPGRAVGVIY